MAQRREEAVGSSLADQANAIASLPPDLALLKLENDTITSLAAAHPRDFQKIKQEIGATFDAFPELAAEAIYSKPVGKDDGGSMKYARNLSIRAAETIKEAYGFSRVRLDTTPLGDDAAKIDGSFTDYQRGNIWQDSDVVSKYYVSRSGKVIRHNDDRFWNVIVKARKSIVGREVILRSVNAGLKAWVFAEAEKRCDALLTDDAIAQIVVWFTKRGIPAEKLEDVVGRARSQGWTKEDRRRLVEIKNALEQNETTVEEIFGSPNGDKEGKPPAGSEAPSEAKGAEEKLQAAMEGSAASAEPQKERAKDEPAAEKKTMIAEILQASSILGREKFDKVLAANDAKSKDLGKYDAEKLEALWRALSAAATTE
jgi:hypothetical protein